MLHKGVAKGDALAVKSGYCIRGARHYNVRILERDTIMSEY